MRTPAQARKPRKSQVVSFPAPSAGLISNRNLAVPVQGGAEVLTNFFPAPQGPRLRRGIRRKATLPVDGPVDSLFTYAVDGRDRIFAAAAGGIWDVTDAQEAYSQAISPATDQIIGTDVTDQGIGWYSIEPADNLYPATAGGWVVVQFATAGGEYLIGVNGVDEAFIYDGTSFEPLSITFPAPPTSSTADFAYVWTYKTRIYFAEKNTLNVWYLPVDQIGGNVTLFPLGGIFPMGGSLLFGQAWSLSSGGDGGLSEQMAIVTTEGEVAIYQGMSPDDASDWSKVGVYQIGRPLGKRAWIRAGGDLVIATTIGFIPLSLAIDKDKAVLGANSVSAPILETWQDMVRDRGDQNWICELFGEGAIVFVAPPPAQSGENTILVTHAETGAWAKFSNWRPTAMETFKGRIYFGSTLGWVQEAMVGGSDEGMPYTGSLMPLFNDLGTPTQMKTAKFVRVMRRASYNTPVQAVARFDWNRRFIAAPEAVRIPVGSEWDNGIWDESTWDTERFDFIGKEWISAGGMGGTISVAVQVTSGAQVPLDVEIARIDVTYEIGDIVT